MVNCVRHAMTHLDYLVKITIAHVVQLLISFGMELFVVKSFYYFFEKRSNLKLNEVK